MADNSKQPPSFLEAWLDDLRDDLRRYGNHKLVPWTMLACCAVGAAVSLLVPKDHFWAKPEVSVVFFTAAVTINGLLLALSWGSFAKIYELASAPTMASFLRRHNLLNGYIFQVDFIHLAQVCAVCWSGAALILSVVGHLPHEIERYLPLLVIQKVSLAGCIASSIYALVYALGAVRMMQDLMWHSAHNLPNNLEAGLQVHEGGRS
jgi:hypothetical protein